MQMCERFNLTTQTVTSPGAGGLDEISGYYQTCEGDICCKFLNTRSTKKQSVIVLGGLKSEKRDEILNSLCIPTN